MATSIRLLLCYSHATKKRAIRAISSAGYNAHTEVLFKFYNVLKVEDIYNYML